jgi:hypothetical protein
MLLLRDLTEDVQFVTETISEGKERSYFIEGPFLQGDIANKNRRRYPFDILQNEVVRYTKEYINEKRAFGELGHPQGPTINLDRVSHMIVSLKEDGKNFIGRAKITKALPMGAIAAGLLDEGAKLGVSSRGMGSVRESNGINEVQKDFFLATAADIVADPSAPLAFVQGIMEGREWMLVDGRWTQQDQEAVVDKIEKTSQRNLEEAFLSAFEDFLEKISHK